jgi:hypothetical protein
MSSENPSLALYYIAANQMIDLLLEDRAEDLAPERATSLRASQQRFIEESDKRAAGGRA